MQPRPTPESPEHRAAVVAGIRALADFIEQRTDLPVPDAIGAQFSQLDVDKTEKTVRAAAAALGVEVSVHADGTGMSARHVLGDEYDAPYYARIDYVVHGFLPAEATREDTPS